MREGQGFVYRGDSPDAGYSYRNGYLLEVTTLHTPTGSVFVEKWVFDNHSTALRYINRWNRQGNGTWVYWANVDDMND